MTSLTSICSKRVHLHPCSVEKMPFIDGLYATGMYELNETTKDRAGCVSVYASPGSLLSSHSIDAGILDMKFNGSLLGCALSTSRLCVIKYAHGSNTESCTIESVSTSSPEEDADDGLFLSLDWSSQSTLEQTAPVDNCFIATSTQNGAVKIYSCSETDGVLQFGSYKSMYDVHKLHGETQPVWIVAFDPHSCSQNGCPNSILTGGDDSMFKLWDVRTMNDGHDCVDGGIRPTAIGKYHQAGVTTAAFHPTNPHVVVTGSYDQNLCVWDKRNLRSPVTAVETDGGIWRIKWGATGIGGKDYVFLSCMQGGSMVYGLDCSGVCSNDCTGTSDTIFRPPVSATTDPSLLKHVITHLPGNSNTPADEPCESTTPIADGQEHLAYGIDIIRSEGATAKDCKVGKFTVASSSFYNNQLYEWNLEI